MSKFKRINPAYLKSQPELWILLRRLSKSGASYNDTFSAATNAGFSSRDIENYRYELGQLGHNPTLRMQIVASERLPKRCDIRKVPFYLRGKVTKYEPRDTYIPNREYSSLSAKVKPYQPILDMKQILHRQRLQIAGRQSEGFIRWPETLSSVDSEFIICKTFDDFIFKVNAGTEGNTLPVVKRYGGIGVHIKAPREFFDTNFWGIGEHLVVRTLDEYYLPNGARVIKTESCDRMDLYDLEELNVRHIRYYVFFEDRSATGLTEAAALKSLGYFMGKEIAKTMGA
jgi:hypothetical protein